MCGWTDVTLLGLHCQSALSSLKILCKCNAVPQDCIIKILVDMFGWTYELCMVNYVHVMDTLLLYDVAGLSINS